MIVRGAAVGLALALYGAMNKTKSNAISRFLKSMRELVSPPRVKYVRQ